MAYQNANELQYPSSNYETIMSFMLTFAVFSESLISRRNKLRFWVNLQREFGVINNKENWISWECLLTCLDFESVDCAQLLPSTSRTTVSSVAVCPAAVTGWCCHVIVCNLRVINNALHQPCTATCKIPKVIFVKQNQHEKRTWHGPLILTVLEHHNVQ